jgi:hypothetical protein
MKRALTHPADSPTRHIPFCAPQKQKNASLYMPPPDKTSRSGVHRSEPMSYAADELSGSPSSRRNGSQATLSARLGRPTAWESRSQAGQSGSESRQLLDGLHSGRSTPAVGGYPKMCIALYDHEPDEVGSWACLSSQGRFVAGAIFVN